MTGTKHKEQPAVKEEVKAEEGFKDRYLRALADLDNYKKRTIQEKDEIFKFSNENLVRELLPALDGFAKAMEFAKTGPSDDFVKGIFLVKKQIIDALAKYGVAEVKAIGEKYDPNFHEAILVKESEGEPGIVISELQKGYTMHGRLIRPSMVIVSKKKEEK